MQYKLETSKDAMSLGKAARGFWPFMRMEVSSMALAIFTVLVNAAANVLAPYMLGLAIDTYITNGDKQGLMWLSLGLIVTYLISAATNYANIVLVGRIGQRVLYRLRQTLFNKIQELPIAFFHQNTSGDLVSRITNDTNTVNQLFAETLVRLLSSIFTLLGIGVFMVVLHPQLGGATLAVAIGLFIITRLSNVFLQRLNKQSLDLVGTLSSDVQTNIENMKAIIAFRRRDYFVKTLQTQNEKVYKASRIASIAGGIIGPVYDFAGNIAQVVVLVYGIALISQGNLTVGVLVSFLAYASKFFEPLRIIASLWANVQRSIAGWKRIIEVLGLTSHVQVLEAEEGQTAAMLEFEHVTFGYTDEKTILHDVSFTVAPGETVAFVGPTGGGKSTTATLMMRLYDPQHGRVLLDGRDIRSYTEEEISDNVGFILQDPVLFTGTVGENIVLGHPDQRERYDREALEAQIAEFGLEEIIQKFPEGIDTQVDPEQASLSLGQQQLIAFMRAVLRKPKLLILDEATANIDTVTEQQLDFILERISKDIAVVIIAHRLNTIQSADKIIFIQGGHATAAQSFEDAVSKIEQATGNS